MLSAIGIWLANSGATALLGFFATVIGDAIKDYRDRQTIKDLATAQTELAQANDTQAATDAELDAAVNKAPRSSADAIERLKGGTA